MSNTFTRRFIIAKRTAGRPKDHLTLSNLEALLEIAEENVR